MKSILAWWVLAWPGAAYAGVAYDLLDPTKSHLAWDGPPYDTALLSPCAGGDLNGDGVPDVVMVAPQANPLGRSNAGQAYVVFGPVPTTNLSRPVATTADVVVHGLGTDRQLGLCLVKDVNDDQQDDLVLQHRSDQSNGNDFTFHVLFGPLSAGTRDLANPAQYDARIWLNSNTHNEWMWMSFGDVNSDRIEDILIAAPYANLTANDSGGLYVLYGPLTQGADKDLTQATAYNYRIYHSTFGSNELPRAIQVADLNADGSNDLVVMGRGSDYLRTDSGAVWITTGPFPSGTGNNRDLAAASSYMVRYDGPQTNTELLSLAAADFNADGKNDLCIGGPEYDGPNGTNAGAVWCLLGPITYGSPGQSVDLANSAAWNVRFDGSAAADRLGLGLAAQDLNNDGLSDLVLVTQSFSNDDGALYIHNGGAAWPSGNGNTKNMASVGSYHTRISAGRANDLLTGVGTQFKDFDGDSNLDIAVSMYRADNASCSDGSIRSSMGVFFGPFSNTTGSNKTVSVDYDLRLDLSVCQGLTYPGVVIEDFDRDGFQDAVVPWRRASVGRNTANGRVYFVSLSTAAPRITEPVLFTSTQAPTVKWTGVASATSYRLVVDQDPRFTSPVHDSTVSLTQSTLPSLVGGETYYARVKAENGAFTRWGPIVTFTVDLTPPTAPTLITPGDDTGTHPSVGTQTPAFDWSDASNE